MTALAHLRGRRGTVGPGEKSSRGSPRLESPSPSSPGPSLDVRDVALGFIHLLPPFFPFALAVGVVGFPVLTIVHAVVLRLALVNPARRAFKGERSRRILTRWTCRFGFLAVAPAAYSTLTVPGLAAVVAPLAFFGLNFGRVPVPPMAGREAWRRGGHPRPGEGRPGRCFTPRRRVWPSPSLSRSCWVSWWIGWCKGPESPYSPKRYLGIAPWVWALSLRPWFASWVCALRRFFPPDPERVIVKETISFTLNGEAVTLETEADRKLLWVLRTDLEKTGTKYGCGVGMCGIVYRAGGRCAGAVLPRRSRLRAGEGRDDHRGPRGGRGATPPAAGVLRAGRLPVRLLHAGDDHECPRPASGESQIPPGTKSSRAWRATCAGAPPTNGSSRPSKPMPGRREAIMSDVTAAWIGGELREAPGRRHPGFREPGPPDPLQLQRGACLPGPGLSRGHQRLPPHRRGRAGHPLLRQDRDGPGGHDLPQPDGGGRSGCEPGLHAHRHGRHRYLPLGHGHLRLPDHSHVRPRRPGGRGQGPPGPDGPGCRAPGCAQGRPSRWRTAWST